MEIISVVGLSAVVVLLVELIKPAVSKKVNANWIALLVGFSVVLAAREANVYENVEILGRTLPQLDFFSCLFAGASISGIGSFGVKYLKARNNNDNSEVFVKKGTFYEDTE